ncbi:MAG: exodeoxyribonuclease III, partial [Bacteroidota bacterium]
YLPSGTNDARLAFKLNYMDEFLNYVTDLKQKLPNLVICGDYNICHQPIDIHDPVRLKNVSGFLPIEREWLTKFINSGFVDSFRQFNNQPHQYSWWSYRAQARLRNKGWRLDYHMVSEPLKNMIKRASILSEARHSDHCPVLVELEV